MDWTKAKNILIAALLITNLVLAGVIFYGDMTEKADRASYLKDAIEILEERNIFIDVELSSKQVRMPVLSVKYDNYDKMLLSQHISMSKALPESQRTESDMISLADDFLKKSDMMTETVKFDRIERSGDTYTVVYINIVNNIAVEDSYIKCLIKNGKITDVKRLWLEAVSFGRNKKEVIPVAEALIRLMSDNQEFEEIHVEKVELVYWLDTSAFDLESPISDTAFPAWKITYNNGMIKHITAFKQ